MTKYEKTVYIGRLKAQELQDYCNVPAPNLRANLGLGKDEPLFDQEVEFCDGDYRMVIQVCQPNDNAAQGCWCQGVLYTKEGTELACTEPSETFLGEYYIHFPEKEFVLTVATLDVNKHLTTHEEADYLEHRGQKCPKCKSEHIEADKLDVDGPIARSNANCCDCGYQWVDLYELCGISEVDEFIPAEESHER